MVEKRDPGVSERLFLAANRPGVEKAGLPPTVVAEVEGVVVVVHAVERHGERHGARLGGRRHAAQDALRVAGEDGCRGDDGPESAEHRAGAEVVVHKARARNHDGAEAAEGAPAGHDGGERGHLCEEGTAA